MDGKDIAAFVGAVENVFGTMIQVHVDVGKPRLKQPGDPRFDVSAIIGLSGDVAGAVVLSFPVETAESVVALLIGQQVSSDDHDFADAIGEVANMVTGNAKAELADRSISISCPSVVVGDGHKVFQQKGRALVEIPYECECGPFVVEVTMQPTTSEDAAPAQPAEAPAAS